MGMEEVKLASLFISGKVFQQLDSQGVGSGTERASDALLQPRGLATSEPRRPPSAVTPGQRVGRVPATRGRDTTRASGLLEAPIPHQ